MKFFSAGKINFNGPIKTLDTKEVTKSTYEQTLKGKHEFQLFECSKIIKDFDTIKRLSQIEEESKINVFFEKREWIKDKSKLLNFRFDFNPYNHVSKIEEMEDFYDYYYEFSEPFIFVPNIRKYRYIDSREKESIIEIKDYLKFVDETYDILNFNNNKYIFVPISLKVSANDMKTLVEHYVNKKYSHFWFDFEGNAITKTNLGRIRLFLRSLKKLDHFDNSVLHYTNINREIVTNQNMDETPASDALSPIAGANIVGVNRKPQRRMIGFVVPPSPNEHKYRLFNKDTYYYDKVMDRNLHKASLNSAINAVRLDNEFADQSKYFLNNDYEIETYLKRKRMLTDYRDGSVLDSLMKK